MRGEASSSVTFYESFLVAFVSIAHKVNSDGGYGKR
jgi:hypothetical protein